MAMSGVHARRTSWDSQAGLEAECLPPGIAKSSTKVGSLQHHPLYPLTAEQDGLASRSRIFDAISGKSRRERQLHNRVL